MLGQPVTMLIPQVIGFKLTGALPPGTTATDLVLMVTEMLRKKGVVDKFVEFFGDGLKGLPLADRATIANMSPEFGSTCAIFPIDEETIRYLELTGRSAEQIAGEATPKRRVCSESMARRPPLHGCGQLDLSRSSRRWLDPSGLRTSPCTSKNRAAVRKWRRNVLRRIPRRRRCRQSCAASFDVKLAQCSSRPSGCAIRPIGCARRAGLLARSALQGLSAEPWVRPRSLPARGGDRLPRQGGPAEGFGTARLLHVGCIADLYR